MTPKKLALVLLKVLISTGLIVWLVSRADVSQIWQTIKTANWGILLLAFSVFFIGYVITATRWKTLLGALGIPAKLRFLIASFSVSIFFNNFLPSTIGGDAYRMYDSYRLGAGKSRAIAVIFIDRVIGLSALLLIAFMASLFAPKVAQQIPFLYGFMFAALAGMGLLAWIVFSSGGKVLLKWFDRDNAVFGLLTKILNKIYAGFHLFEGRYDVLSKAMGLSLLLQTNVVIHCILIAKALHIDIPVLAMFIVIPLSFLIMTAPISINGIGLRESVFVFFFALFAVPQEQALAFSFVSFGMILAQGVIGGLVFMFRKSHSDQPSPSVFQEPD